MDYCSSCRRILNGALVCPGCGAYAPDIAPPSHLVEGATAKAPTVREGREPEGDPFAWSYFGKSHADDGATLTALHTSAGTVEDMSDTDWFGHDPSDTASSGIAASFPDFPGIDSPGEGGTATAAGAALATGGRAARRRQLARWKKHRRRAAAVTAVALVGGGMTITALDNGSSAGHAEAASSPESFTPATAWTPSTQSPTQQPQTHAPSHPSAHTSTASGPRQDTNAAISTTANAAPAPSASVATYPAAATSPPASAATATSPAAAAAPVTHHSTAPAAPRTSAPATPTSHPSTGPSAPSALPTTSSKQLCVLVLCVG